MDEHSISRTLNYNSRASHPGGLRVQPLRWIRFYPAKPLTMLAGLLGSIVGAFLMHWGFAVVSLLLLWINYDYWLRVRERFHFGCTNPAVIVSLNPTLIAVSTNLVRRGLGEFAAIRIIRHSLPKIRGESPRVGTLLTTVSLYTSPIDPMRPHWADFSPIPADCASGDPQQQDRLMQSLGPEEWEKLEMRLAEVPRPFEPGLYTIRWHMPETERNIQAPEDL